MCFYRRYFVFSVYLYIEYTVAQKHVVNGRKTIDKTTDSYLKRIFLNTWDQDKKKSMLMTFLI